MYNMEKKGSGKTYFDYLRLDSLLALQNGFNASESEIGSDELLFIIVHQAYELWFKQIIHEVREARDLVNLDFVPESSIPLIVHKLKRVCSIFKLAISQFEVLETLAPGDFLEFRDKLGTASGFQSIQMREMEILLGLEESQRFALGGSNALDHIRRSASTSISGKNAFERVEALMNETNFKTALYSWLYRTPIDGSFAENEGDSLVVSQFLERYMNSYQRLTEEQFQQLKDTIDDPQPVRSRLDQSVESVKNFLLASDVPQAQRSRIKRVRAGILFIESYRDLPLLAWPRELLDAVVELEQQFIVWRQRHSRMVERMIGRRVGTGGSSGVDYLDKTGTYRIFTDLW
ncbi:MAG TPA: tryptophan 2,3-dioxygenase family protein, partial [Candidatus Hodarchaeales archaeon]|nr:tryptophan 2,3-dioxygenase family protein [Candidatus Hodarchaeales archaeon]